VQQRQRPKRSQRAGGQGPSPPLTLPPYHVCRAVSRRRRCHQGGDEGRGQPAPKVAADQADEADAPIFFATSRLVPAGGRRTVCLAATCRCASVSRPGRWLLPAFFLVGGGGRPRRRPAATAARCGPPHAARQMRAALAQPARRPPTPAPRLPAPCYLQRGPVGRRRPSVGSVDARRRTVTGDAAPRPRPCGRARPSPNNARGGARAATLAPANAPVNQGVDPYLQPNQIQPNIYVEGNPSRSTEVEFNTYLFSRGARLSRQFLLDRPHTTFQEAFSRRSR